MSAERRKYIKCAFQVNLLIINFVFSLIFLHQIVLDELICRAFFFFFFFLHPQQTKNFRSNNEGGM